MKKLIKADLSKVLELTAAYQPIDHDSLRRNWRFWSRAGITIISFWPGKTAFT